MGKLTATEVTAALSKGLGGEVRADLARSGSAGRITGWIVHPAFDGVPRINRQEWLWEGSDEEDSLPRWEGLRGHFGGRAAQIGMLFTFSPREYAQTFVEAA